MIKWLINREKIALKFSQIKSNQGDVLEAAYFKGKAYAYREVYYKLYIRKEAILEKLNKLCREHYQCEDGGYPCPLSEEGCFNDQDEDCTCGAEQHNHLLDEIKELL